ncbi:MAG: class I SAM-dependent methyltransferase [Ktedonobacterales bacterium]
MRMFPRATTQNRLDDHLPADFGSLLDQVTASSSPSAMSSLSFTSSGTFTTTPASSSPAEPPYLLPRDAQEQARQELTHYALRGAFQRNHLAPVDAPASVLDIGSGAGHWAMEIAHTFPDAYVLGIDIALPETDEFFDSSHAGALRRPNNCSFMQCDALRPLPFAHESFAYTHMRLMHLGIPVPSWPLVMNEVLRVTRMRGWVELVEGDLPRNGGPALDRLVSWLRELAYRRGIDPGMGSQVGAWAHERGLHRMVAHEIELPVGAYGGRLGNMLAAGVFAQIEALRPALVTSGIAADAAFEHALMAARFEVMHAQCVQPLYIAYGQR